MFVRDCMTDNPTTVEPGTNLHEAIDLMRAFKIRHLPVLDRGRLVGILTSTDLARAQPSPATSLTRWEIPTLLQQAQVRDIMTREVITVAPDVPVEQAAWTLRRHKIGALPVLEHDMLMGIVTESDLFDVLLFLLGGDISGVRVTVDLPGGLEDLVKLVAQLDSGENGKTRLTANVRLDGSVHRAHVCLSTETPLRLAEGLAAANLKVSGLRFDPPVKPHRVLS